MVFLYSKKALTLVFLVLVSFSVFADQQTDLQTQCLSKNEPNRQIFVFSVTQGTPAPSQGGSVESNIVEYQYDQSTQSTVPVYANCIQVDCVQDAFSTQQQFNGCFNGLAKYNQYAVSYVFPACQANYVLNSPTQSDPICQQCGDDVVLTPLANDSCVNGYQTVSQTVKTHYDSVCTESTIKRTFITAKPCQSQGNTTNLLVGLLVLLAGGFLFRKRLKLVK